MAVFQTIDSKTGTVTVTPPTPQDINLATLTAQALTAFNTNRAGITANTAALAVANPTTAQVISAVKMLLQQNINLQSQNNALMRLVLGLLDGTD